MINDLKVISNKLFIKFKLQKKKIAPFFFQSDNLLNICFEIHYCWHLIKQIVRYFPEMLEIFEKNENEND